MNPDQSKNFTLSSTLMRKAAAFLLLTFSLSAAAQSDFEVFEADIVTLQEAMSSGSVTAVELVQKYLDRIEAYDRNGPRLNSIIRVNPGALEQAAVLDAERARGQLRGPLHGIPILVKDNYNTDFMPTTGGSVALAAFTPSRNATQVQRLLDAGAIVLAKTNLHEYAYGITTVSSILGQTRNPYDLRRVPGGSSGGTGAGVAASFAAIGLGSDTCGSVRIPSAFNNLIGLRPSKGLSSIYGVMPLSHTQDVAAPLARSAEDLALVLDVVSGFDAADEATAVMADIPAPAFAASLGGAQLNRLRIGRLAAYLDAADASSRHLIDAALDWYAAQGAEIIDVEIPDLADLLAGSGVIGHEFRTDLDAYLQQFGSEEIDSLEAIVDRGLYHRAVDAALSRSRDRGLNEEAYASALSARLRVRGAVEAVMTELELDAIAYPPIAETPVMIGESQPGNNCSLSANSGLPALSMPVGFSNAGLPVGMELLGGFLADAQLLAMAHAYEQANSPRRAPASTPPLKAAATTIPVALRFRVGDVSLEGSIEFDGLRNLLRFDIAMAADSEAEIHAVTLVVDREPGLQINDPIVFNLMGPQQSRASGEHHMTPEFRQAFLDRRVYLRVFAEGLFPSGVLENLRPQ